MQRRTTESVSRLGSGVATGGGSARGTTATTLMRPDFQIRANLVRKLKEVGMGVGVMISGVNLPGLVSIVYICTPKSLKCENM